MRNVIDGKEIKADGKDDTRGATVQITLDPDDLVALLEGFHVDDGGEEYYKKNETYAQEDRRKQFEAAAKKSCCKEEKRKPWPRPCP